MLPLGWRARPWREVAGVPSDRDGQMLAKVEMQSAGQASQDALVTPLASDHGVPWSQ